MIKEYCLELFIKENDKKMLHSLFKALKPDTYNVPNNCNVKINLSEGKDQLYMRISCSKINDLRALFNSYYNIISTILHIWEEENESTITSTGGSTNSGTVPNDPR